MVASATTACAARRNNRTAEAPAPCTMVIPAGVAGQPIAERSLPASQWFSLLLYGYMPSGAITRPATDCSGRRVDWLSDRCSGLPGPSAPLADRPLTAADLVVGNPEGESRLLWALTEHFADGQAQGPVALVRFDAKSVKVEAMGVLRAHRTNTRLHLQNTAGGTLLVAEGEACTVPQDPSTCSRTARLVPLVENRFTPVDLSDAAGKCVGSALLLLKSQGTIGHGTGRKDFQFESALTYSADGVAVHEQLSVEERSKDGTAGTFLRRVQAERRVFLQRGALLATAPSILDLWLAARQKGE